MRNQPGSNTVTIRPKENSLRYELIQIIKTWYKIDLAQITSQGDKSVLEFQIDPTECLANHSSCYLDVYWQGTYSLKSLILPNGKDFLKDYTKPSKQGEVLKDIIKWDWVHFIVHITPRENVFQDFPNGPWTWKIVIEETQPENPGLLEAYGLSVTEEGTELVSNKLTLEPGEMIEIDPTSLPSDIEETGFYPGRKNFAGDATLYVGADTHNIEFLSGTLSVKWIKTRARVKAADIVVVRNNGSQTLEVGITILGDYHKPVKHSLEKTGDTVKLSFTIDEDACLRIKDKILIYYPGLSLVDMKLDGKTIDKYELYKVSSRFGYSIASISPYYVSLNCQALNASQVKSVELTFKQIETQPEQQQKPEEPKETAEEKPQPTIQLEEKPPETPWTTLMLIGAVTVVIVLAILALALFLKRKK